MDNILSTTITPETDLGSIFGQPDTKTVEINDTARGEYSKEKSIGIEDIKENPEKVKLNFFGPNSDPNAFFGEKTSTNAGATSTEAPKPNLGETPGVFGLSNSAIDSNEPRPRSYFKPIAEFLMRMYNAGLSSGLKWWAKGGSVEQFAIPKDQERQLADMAGELMYMYQKKVNPVTVFLCGLGFITALNFWNAWQMRKEVLSKEDDNAKIRANAKAVADKKAQEDAKIRAQKERDIREQQQNTEAFNSGQFLPTLVADNHGVLQEPEYTDYYKMLGFTEQECKQGFYLTSKSKRKIQITFDERGLPKPKLGKQPKVK